MSFGEPSNPNCRFTQKINSNRIDYPAFDL